MTATATMATIRAYARRVLADGAGRLPECRDGAAKPGPERIKIA